MPDYLTDHSHVVYATVDMVEDYEDENGAVWLDSYEDVYNAYPNGESA